MTPIYNYKIYFLNPIDSSDESIENFMALLDAGYEIYNTTAIGKLIVYIVRREE